MNWKHFAAVAAAGFIAAGSAAAGEAACVDAAKIVAALGIPDDMPVKQVETKPLDGLTGVCAYVFETSSGRQVVIGGERYLFNGKLLDMERREVAQEAILRKYQKIGMDDFKMMAADGDFAFRTSDAEPDASREVVVFADPECPYSRKLLHELAKIDELTAHVQLTPLSNHLRGIAISKTIVCGELSFGGVASYYAYVDAFGDPDEEDAPSCGRYDDRQAMLKGLGKKHLMTGGVPKLFFADGTYELGAMRQADIEAKLKAVAAPAAEKGEAGKGKAGKARKRPGGRAR